MRASLIAFAVMLFVGGPLHSVAAPGPRAPAAASCSTLYGQGRVNEAITACNAAEDELRPHFSELTDLYHRKARLTPSDEEYALRQGQSLFVIAFVRAQILSHNGDPTRAHTFALDAATWALLLAALLQHNDPVHQTALFRKWSPIVNSFIHSANALSPGILAQVRATRSAKE